MGTQDSGTSPKRWACSSKGVMHAQIQPSPSPHVKQAAVSSGGTLLIGSTPASVLLGLENILDLGKELRSPTQHSPQAYKALKPQKVVQSSTNHQSQHCMVAQAHHDIMTPASPLFTHSVCNPNTPKPIIDTAHLHSAAGAVHCCFQTGLACSGRWASRSAHNGAPLCVAVP